VLFTSAAVVVVVVVVGRPRLAEAQLTGFDSAEAALPLAVNRRNWECEDRLTLFDSDAELARRASSTY
jgi:hypothetical protein